MAFAPALFPSSVQSLHVCIHSEVRVTHIAHVMNKNGNVVYNTCGIVDEFSLGRN